MFAVQPSAVVVMVGAVLPVDWVKITPPAPIVEEYLTESAKYASSAVTRLRRSDFIEARYAFSFVLANFGIAIADRKSTRLNSSHDQISYAVFCLKKKKIHKRLPFPSNSQRASWMTLVLGCALLCRLIWRLTIRWRPRGNRRGASQPRHLSVNRSGIAPPRLLVSVASDHPN